MKTVSQLSIFLQNKPGAFSRVCAAFHNQGINIEAIMVEDASDHAVVRMVVDNTQKAKDLLEDHGAVSLENEILAIEMLNQPGQLVEAAEKLAQAKININYAYGSAPGADPKQKVILYIHVDDAKAALKVLRG